MVEKVKDINRVAGAFLIGAAAVSAVVMAVSENPALAMEMIGNVLGALTPDCLKFGPAGPIISLGEVATNPIAER